MLRIASELKGYEIIAMDGRLGAVSDFLFDDTTWKIRWLVDETGGWLSGHKVLIHATAIGPADDVHQRLAVNLMTEAVRNSPAIGQDEPVLRQFERRCMAITAGIRCGRDGVSAVARSRRPSSPPRSPAS